MDIKELKKVLAGIGVVGLLAGGGVSIPGNVGASSGCGGSGCGGTKDSAVSAGQDATSDDSVDEAVDEEEVVQDVAGSGCSAASGCSGSGCAAAQEDDAAGDDESKDAEKPASSGCSG